MAAVDPTQSMASPERQPDASPRQYAYLSLPQSQRLRWTAALGVAFTLVTWFAWTREAPAGPLPAPYSWARFFRPFERNREFRTNDKSPDLYSVSFVDSQHGWAVGDGGIVGTTDGGRTWQSVSSPSGFLEGVYFLDAQRGWAVGDSILATADGGVSWHSQLPSSEHSAGLRSVYFANAQRGWVVASGGRILATGDGGLSWNSKSLPLANKFFFRSVHFVDAQRGWVVGGAVVATEDGGLSWQAQLSAFPSKYLRWAAEAPPNYLYSVHFVDVQRGWAVGDDGTILVTENGGMGWQSQSSNTSARLDSVHFVDAQHGWAVGGGGTILATDDGGTHWRQQPLPVYWSFCPPWYLWTAPLFLVGLVVLNRRRVETHQGILGAGTQDSPVEKLDQDALGAYRLVNTLVGFVTNRATLPPLCITVEGPWGTGKSSVLQMIRSQLQKKRAAQTVWFNAWHHQKEDPLLAYLLEAIKREAVPPLLSPSGLLFRLDLLVVRLKDKWFQFAISAAAIVAAAMFWLRIPPFTQIPSWVKLPGDLHGPLATLAALGYFYYTLLRAFGSKPEKLLASSRALLNFGDLRGKTDVRTDFQKELKDVVKALEAQQRRLVIFLDDLDRCRPNQVVVVMEAVNFLSSAADCFIFLGIDRQKVLTAVGLYYQDLAREEALASGQPSHQVRRRLAESYLQKMINLRTHVPQPDEQETMDYLKNQAQVKGGFWYQLASRAAMVVLALVVGAGVWGVQEFSATPAPASKAVDTPVPAGNPNNASQPSVTNSPPPIPDTKGRVPKPTAVPLPADAPARWPWISAVGATALLSLLFWLRVRLRPDIEDTQDRPEFLEALAIASPAIWTKGLANPREMKRIRNMLRFLAASDRARKDRPGGYLKGRLRPNADPSDPTWEPSVVGFAAFGPRLPWGPCPAGWRWTPTEKHAEAYKELCSFAELDPNTLQPADETPEPPAAQQTADLKQRWRSS